MITANDTPTMIVQIKFLEIITLGGFSAEDRAQERALNELFYDREPA